MGGRNRKVAMEMVKTGKVTTTPMISGLSSNLTLLQSFRELEEELLNGQKLQGPQTADEINEFLLARGKENIKRPGGYPLFETVWKICYQVRTKRHLNDWSTHICIYRT
jgi:glycerol-3-phosphate dehydrogenase (NAD+)